MSKLAVALISFFLGALSSFALYSCLAIAKESDEHINKKK